MTNFGYLFDWPHMVLPALCTLVYNYLALAWQNKRSRCQISQIGYKQTEIRRQTENRRQTDSSVYSVDFATKNCLR